MTAKPSRRRDLRKQATIETLSNFDTLPGSASVTPEQDRDGYAICERPNFVASTSLWSPTWQGYDIYRQLAFPLPYTGSILIGADQPEDCFRMTGFACPSDYLTVIQVQFEEGNVVRLDDVSKIFEVFRSRYERNIYEDDDLDYAGPFPDLQRNGQRYLKRHLPGGYRF